MEDRWLDIAQYSAGQIMFVNSAFDDALTVYQDLMLSGISIARPDDLHDDVVLLPLSLCHYLVSLELARIRQRQGLMDVGERLFKEVWQRLHDLRMSRECLERNRVSGVRPEDVSVLMASPAQRHHHHRHHRHPPASRSNGGGLLSRSMSIVSDSSAVFSSCRTRRC